MPERAGDGVKYQGVLYRKLYDYTGKATYVLGEFYWKLERDARTYNTDYMGTGALRHAAPEPRADRAGRRRRRSSGRPARRSSADAVLKAFKLAPDKRAALQRDALPTSGNAASLLAKVFFWVFVVVVAADAVPLRRRSRDCSQLRATYGEASAEYQNCLRSAAAAAGAPAAARSAAAPAAAATSDGSTHWHQRGEAT